MFYIVKTLKESQGQTINTDFVFQGANETLIRDFFTTYKIIILSMYAVPGWPKSAQFFGELPINETENAEICLSAPSAQAFVQRCVDLDLPLRKIYAKDGSITVMESENLIRTLTKTREDQQKQIRQQQEAEAQKQQLILDDKKKERIMKVIDETLTDINTLQAGYGPNVALTNDQKKLEEFKDQLIKIKMGNNIEKATAILEETLALMEKIEMGLIFNLKEQEQQINQQSIVSNIDIITELDKIKRAKQTTEAGLKNKNSDLYYSYLGIVGLYQKFIAKDFFAKISEIKGLISNIDRYIAYMITVGLTVMGGFVLYALVTDTVNYKLPLTMIWLSVAGLVREMLQLLPLQTSWKNLIYIILAILLTMIIYKGIIIIFALV